MNFAFFFFLNCHFFCDFWFLVSPKVFKSIITCSYKKLEVFQEIFRIFHLNVLFMYTFKTLLCKGINHVLCCKDFNIKWYLQCVIGWQQYQLLVSNLFVATHMLLRMSHKYLHLLSQVSLRFLNFFNGYNCKIQLINCLFRW